MLKLGAFAVAVIVCAAAISAWRADRHDRVQLVAELTATKQLLTAAHARQRDHDAQLAQTLSTLERQRRAIITPDQILRQLQKNIPLPEPLTLDQAPQVSRASATITHAPNPTPESTGNKLPATARPAQTSAQPEAPSQALIPRADLTPLYDFTLDCQARLSVAQTDLADEKAKTDALIKERDDAVRIAKGGTAWRRVTRAARWFLLGAAAGAVVAKAH